MNICHIVSIYLPGILPGCSGYDSFGILYLEVWRYGKLVIGAEAGAIPEVIKEGEDGLLVEFGDVNQLASAIPSLLNNPALYKEMGEAGRKRCFIARTRRRTFP